MLFAHPLSPPQICLRFVYIHSVVLCIVAVRFPNDAISARASMRHLRDNPVRSLSIPCLSIHKSARGEMDRNRDLEDDDGEVFLDDEDAIQEITIDEEELPDADDGASSDADLDERDDSLHIFTGHSGELYTVACSPTDAELVVTGGGDDKGFLWKIGRADWAAELQGHKDSVSITSFSFDGQLVASGSFDGTIQVWDQSGNLKSMLEGPGGGIEWLKWHPRGHLILAGSEDSTVWMWNADKGSYLNMFSGHGSSVTCGDFSPDGKSVCTGSDDASLRIWNPKTGENIHVVRGHPYHTEGLTCLAVTSDSTCAITGAKDGSVHAVNVVTGKFALGSARPLSPHESQHNLRYMVEDKWNDLSHDWAVPKVIHSLVAHSDSVECIGLSRSHPWAATGGMDRKLFVYDLQHSMLRCTCEHEEGVTCLTWLGASQYIATGCADGKVRVWDSLLGDCRKTFSGHSDVVQSLAISANGDFLVSVSLDGTARVFEIAEFR